MKLIEKQLIPLAKSGIHIKESNRGKFTDYCGGKVTSECINRGKNSSDPKIRKRATFAANARAWKHLYGGTLTDIFSTYTSVRPQEFRTIELSEPWKYPITPYTSTQSESTDNNTPSTYSDIVDLSKIPGIGIISSTRQDNTTQLTSSQTTVQPISSQTTVQTTSEPYQHSTTTRISSKQRWRAPNEATRRTTLEKYEGLSARFVKDFTSALKKYGVGLGVLDYLLGRSVQESSYGRTQAGTYNYGNITTGVTNYDGTKYDMSKATRVHKDGSANNRFKNYDNLDEYLRDSIAYLERKYGVDLNNDDFETILRKANGWSEAKIDDRIREALREAKQYI